MKYWIRGAGIVSKEKTSKQVRLPRVKNEFYSTAFTRLIQPYLCCSTSYAIYFNLHKSLNWHQTEWRYRMHLSNSTAFEHSLSVDSILRLRCGSMAVVSSAVRRPWAATTVESCRSGVTSLSCQCSTELVRSVSWHSAEQTLVLPEMQAVFQNTFISYLSVKK